MAINERSHLRVIRTVATLPAFYTIKSAPHIGVGIVAGLSDNHDAPLLVRLPSGVFFACGGLSKNQRLSAIAGSSVGQTVSFFYQSMDLLGRPIRPLFKSLMLNKGDANHEH